MTNGGQLEVQQWNPFFAPEERDVYSYLDIKVPHVERVVFNEFAPRLYSVAH